MLNREQIEFCMDEGVCCHCGKAIRWGHDPVYSINGSHYDCQFPNGRPASPFESVGKLLFGEETKRNSTSSFGEGVQPALARANGGHVLHWVVPNTGVAMCGHKPKNTSWKMKARGKWLRVPAGADVTGRRVCPTCASKHVKAFPELQVRALVITDLA